MNFQLASSKSAQDAFQLVCELQSQFVELLENLQSPLGKSRPFERVAWLREGGACGGGFRLMAARDSVFNRASVNVSQVHYEKDVDKKVSSATAISTIVHPLAPQAPSFHMHISWTEPKQKKGYWRIMADLNPSCPEPSDALRFRDAFALVMPEALLKLGEAQGERYFQIPALRRSRGVAHFYLEEFFTENDAADMALARNFGQRMVEVYASIVSGRIQGQNLRPDSGVARQLEYHSVYFLQVLTLDRGTTAGLLVHCENDVGVLASLPSHVSRNFIEKCVPLHPSLQQMLLRRILAELPNDDIVHVTDEVKVRIANVLRSFYNEYPQAQELLSR